MKPRQTQSFITILLLLCIAVPVHTVANPVSLRQAQQNAIDFMQDRNMSIAVSSLRQASMRVSQDDVQDIYLFNIVGNNGYVIVAGDDCVPPILGYSEKGTVDVEHMPDSMKAWLEGYAEQIRFYRSQGRHAFNSSTLTVPNHPAISPLLTCYWGQDEPYNDLCPVDTDGNRCVTGCVATAMAQVMYYYRDRSVNQTTREMPAYTTMSHNLQVDGIPAGAFIDWDNMKDRYVGTETTAQKLAVANLMKYCGAALNMNYGSNESSSNLSFIPRALIAYFNYSSKMVFHSKSNYTVNAWDNLIYSELALGRPLLYAGTDGGLSGHAFVCDGYASNGYYHMNWGWGGNEGYYLLSLESSSESLIPFNYKQRAIIGAEPRASLPSGQGDIDFSLPTLLGRCLQAGDADDDGVLTVQEAAAVTNSDLFDFYKDPIAPLITSLDEFQYFTGITSINSYAFYYCPNLESIHIPNSVTTIEGSAFRGCTGLTSVKGGTSVATIDEYAFYKCSALTDSLFGDCIQSIGYGAFCDCSALNGVKLDGPLTTIGNSAFYNCAKLTDARLGDAVTSVGDYAFANCAGLTSVYFGPNINNIGLDVFKACRNVKDFTWNVRNYTTGFTIPTSVERLVIGDDAEVIPVALAKSSKVKSVTVGKAVTAIDQSAFAFCTDLTTINVPNSITSIGNYAFSGCKGLTTVPIPSALAVLGASAFANCTGITSATIPSTLVSIGLSPFGGCENLVDLTWNAPGCITSFTLPATIERLSFGNKIVTIPDNFAKDESKLKSVTFGNALTSIGSAAFSGCAGLTQVTFPASVSSIGANAFKGCNQLLDVTCLPVSPPNASLNSFSTYSQATLNVPATVLEAYKAATPWKMFSNFVGVNMVVGDVNVDGEINIADVNAVIDIILANDSSDSGDVNGDGEVNIADINALIDIILNHQ